MMGRSSQESRAKELQVYASTEPRQFWRDGDGRLREVLDVQKCLALQSGRYVAVRAEPKPGFEPRRRDARQS